MNVSVLAITKNGISTCKRLKLLFPEWFAYAPIKFLDNNDTTNQHDTEKDIIQKDITYYTEQTSSKIVKLFNSSDALICLFSLGAVIRLIAPHLKDKKTDPAVIVIDDKEKFVISVLSGHIGGANELANQIAKEIDAISVITTAADVNKTIAVDLVGREFGWKIQDDSVVTRVSAHMVNEEEIGVFQDAGNKNWYKLLPKNVAIYDNIDSLFNSNSVAHLIISDRIIKNHIPDTVVYRPPSLVVGVGLHHDTPKDTILAGIKHCVEEFGLYIGSIARLISIKKPQDIQGLILAGKELQVPVEYIDREELSKITTPNPSDIVKTFEGTPSVSEAAALLSSGGELVVEKQKFPPNLTIAIARMIN